MNKSIILLIAGLLFFPTFATADLLNYFSAGPDTERFSIDGKFELSTASIDIDDDSYAIYNAHFQLGLEAKIVNNIALGGRLDADKYWGDFNDFHTDTIRAERAYLNWWDIADSDFYLSMGRRPLFYSSPSAASTGSMHIGSPYGHPTDFNIDGVTIGYLLSPLTGIEGMDIRLSYGNGIKSEWGNDNRLKDSISKHLADAQLGGLNFDLFNDGKTFLQLSLFRAMDVNDGVNGVVAFPIQYAQLFAPTLYIDIQKFPTFNFTTRSTPTTVIGDITMLGLNTSHEMDNGLILFGSVAMSQLDPNGKAGLFGGLGSDAVYEAFLSGDGSEVYMAPVRAENNDSQDGYGVYIGIQIPAPMGKVGLEYNYGSEYWTPFTQAQGDQADVFGHKLDTRGHAAEAYYLFEINHYASIKVGGIYYDYEYTGSGSPVGKPIKIDDIENGSAYSLMPVTDIRWDAYAKITIDF